VTFKKAVRDLLAHKLRSLLVILSIAVGVFGVSAVSATKDELNATLDRLYHNANQPDLRIPVWPPATPRLERAVGRIANVKALEGHVEFATEWVPETSREPIVVVGLANLGKAGGMNYPDKTKGAFPGQGELLLEDSAVRLFAGLGPGSRVRVVTSHGVRIYRISGLGHSVAFTPAPLSGEAVAFMSRAQVEELSGLHGDTTLLVRARDFSKRNGTAREIRAALGSLGETTGALTIRDPNSYPGKDVVNSVLGLMEIFGWVALITSSFLIINTISTVVAEQRNQIGSMKAIGARTGSVMRVYLALVLLYAAVATLLGLILGVLGAHALLSFAASFLNFPVTGLTISAGPLVMGAIAGIGIALLAALLPAWLGSRVSIREAIASYGLGRSFGRGVLDRLAASLRFLPISTTLAVRNLTRNRTRLFLTLVGLIVTGAAIIAVYSVNYSLNRTLTTSFHNYQADLVFFTAAPVSAPAFSDTLKSVDGVRRTEIWLTLSVKFQGEDGTAFGIPERTGVYDRRRLSSGRWFESGDRGVVITTKQLAQRRDLRLGDRIALSSDSGSARWRIIGIVDDVANGDTAFYAPMSEVTRLAGIPEQRGDLALIRLANSAPASVDRTRDEIAAALARAHIPADGRAVAKIEAAGKSQFQIIAGLLYVIVVIIGLVGALALFGTITMGVLERRREIGVMRSVGARTRTLVWIFLLEGLVLGLVGWLVSIALGYVAARWLAGVVSETLLPLTFFFPTASVFVTLVVILVVSFLAAIGPSLGAARTRISDTLRYS
jgi:putative ABC transport system permease protein